MMEDGRWKIADLCDTGAYAHGPSIFIEHLPSPI